MKIIKESFDSTPKKLYHSTFNKESTDWCDVNGITRDSYGHIYLSEKPIIYDNKRKAGWTTTYAVYEVVTDDLNLKDLVDWRDIWGDGDDDEKQYDESNPYWIYFKDIPVSCITKVYDVFENDN